MPTIWPDGPGTRLGNGVSGADQRRAVGQHRGLLRRHQRGEDGQPERRRAALRHVVERAGRADLAVGTAATPPVITGIIARPIPPARSASSAAISPVRDVERDGRVARRCRWPRSMSPIDRGPARADLVVEPSGDRHQHGHDQRLRQQQQTRVERADALGLLEEQRDVEQRGEQADHQHGDQQQRVRVRPVLEHADVQQRVLDLELDDHEQGEQDRRGGQQADDAVARPAPVLALRQRQQQREQPARDREEAEHVELSAT